MAYTPPFIRFMLGALLIALNDIDYKPNDIRVDKPDYFAILAALNVLGKASLAEVMQELELKHKPSFRKNYLIPALEAGYVDMLYPDSPKSPKQKYLLNQERH
jgi:hypothetical protein